MVKIFSTSALGAKFIRIRHCECSQRSNLVFVVLLSPLRAHGFSAINFAVQSYRLWKVYTCHMPWKCTPPGISTTSSPPSKDTLSGTTRAARPLISNVLTMCWTKFNTLYPQNLRLASLSTGGGGFSLKYLKSLLLNLLLTIKI